MGRKNRKNQVPGPEEFPPLPGGQASTSSQPDDEFNEFDVNNEVSDNEMSDDDDLDLHEGDLETRLVVAEKMLESYQKEYLIQGQAKAQLARESQDEITELKRTVAKLEEAAKKSEKRRKDDAEVKKKVAKLEEEAKTAKNDRDEAQRRYNEQKKIAEEWQAELKELKRAMDRLTEGAKTDKQMETDEVQCPPETITRAKKRQKPDKHSDVSSSEEEMPKKQPRTTRPATEDNEDTAPLPTEAEKPAEKIPPVVLRKKDEWTKVKKIMEEKKIGFERAKLIADGVAVTPTSPNDHRKLTKMLAENKYEYHTYSLKEDRQMRVVIRGIPTDITDKEIKEDLERQGYAPRAVHRMTCRRTRALMPLVLVQAALEDKEILNINRCCSLVVRTEMQRTQQTTSQCHRCQKFGHGQARCAALPKCVKCGQDHASTECAKKREEPAKCANCQGDHPASYRGCPSFPKKSWRRTNAKPEKFTHPRAVTHSRPARTFAEAVNPAAGRTSNSDATNTKSLQDVVNQILETIEGWQRMLPALLAQMTGAEESSPTRRNNNQQRR